MSYTVPMIENNTVASAATFNAPLEYIQGALNQLQEQLTGSDARSCLLQHQAPISSDVQAGDLVYFDPVATVYKKAIAKEASTATGVKEDVESHVQGLVLSVNSTGNSAVILKSGFYISQVIETTLGNGNAGLYYLSSSDYGRAAETVDGNIRIPCISYYGQNKFSFMPFCHSSIQQQMNIVKGLQSQTLYITSDSEQIGIYHIEQPVKEEILGRRYGSAIASISEDTIYKTPVVSELIQGPGIVLANMGAGGWQISAQSFMGSPIASSDFTLNGAQRVADTLLTYTVFPKNAQTSLIMTLPAHFITGTTEADLHVWLTSRGQGTITYSIKIYWLPYSTVNIESCEIGNTSITASNVSTTTLLYHQSQALRYTFGGPGVIVAKITATNPSTDCYIHQAGFKLQAIESSVSNQNEIASTDGLPADLESAILRLMQRYLRFNPPANS